jgi:hypothetical protein
MHATLQMAGGRWAERVCAEGKIVVIRQVFQADLRPTTFFFGDECGFRRGRGAGLGLDGSFGLPFDH